MTRSVKGKGKWSVSSYGYEGHASTSLTVPHSSAEKGEFGHCVNSRCVWASPRDPAASPEPKHHDSHKPQPVQKQCTTKPQEPQVKDQAEVKKESAERLDKLATGPARKQSPLVIKRSL